MAKAQPWLGDLPAASTHLLVYPHLRWQTLQCFREAPAGWAFEDAAAMEAAAFDVAQGDLYLYTHFVQAANTPERGWPSPEAFRSWCEQAGDDAPVARPEAPRLRDELLAHLQDMRFDLTDSHRRCPLCRCAKLLVDERQTRGADEETTKFYTCTSDQCRHRFR